MTNAAAAPAFAAPASAASTTVTPVDDTVDDTGASTGVSVPAPRDPLRTSVEEPSLTLLLATPTPVDRPGRGRAVGVPLQITAPAALTVTNTSDTVVSRVLVSLMVNWNEDSDGTSPVPPLRLHTDPAVMKLEGAPHHDATVAPTQYWTVVVPGPLAPDASATLPLRWRPATLSSLVRLGTATAVVTATASGAHRATPAFSLISTSADVEAAASLT